MSPRSRPGRQLHEVWLRPFGTAHLRDGRGSVAAEVSYNSAWYTLGGTLSKKDVISKSYTPFGEQIGEAVSGFGYNGEYYNAATGMVYLRARFYEPEMNRFSQKDIIRGSVATPSSLNRYTYVQNDPINFIDPSGQSLKSFVKSAANKISSAAKTVVSKAKTVVNKVTTAVKTTVNKVVNAAKSTYNKVSTAVKNVVSRGTSSSGSTSSYRGPSGGGSYSAAPSGYNPSSNGGNGNSYYNGSNYYNKVPSPDAPRIEDVSVDNVYYCSPNKPVASGNVVLAEPSRNLPTEGEPGSDQTLKNPDGTPKQKRWYGDDGKPVRDRDYNHPGKDIPFPHDHEWKDGKRQKEHLPPSPEYQSSLAPVIGSTIIIVGGVIMSFVIADNMTGIGFGDDFLLGPIGALISKGIVMAGA